METVICSLLHFLHHGVGFRDGVCTMGRKALVAMPTCS